jgi:hypothetical protein
VGFRDLRPGGSCGRFLEEIRSRPQSLASSLTLLVAGPSPSEPGTLEAIGRRVVEVSPHTLVQLVVDWAAFPPYAPWERIASAFHVPWHYLDSIHYYKVDQQERFSVRLFHLTGDTTVADRYFTDDDAPPFDLLLRFSAALLDPESSLLDHRPLLLLDGAAGPLDTAALEHRYRGLEGLIVTWKGENHG